MYKRTAILGLNILLTGCNLYEVGQTLSDEFDLPQPTVWNVKHGTEVDIGGQVVSIVGQDNCNTGFGEIYRCWKFSLLDGDKNMVTLSNGSQEIWTTVDRGNGRVSLVRPNGVVVAAN